MREPNAGFTSKSRDCSDFSGENNEDAAHRARAYPSLGQLTGPDSAMAEANHETVAPLTGRSLAMSQDTKSGTAIGVLGEIPTVGCPRSNFRS